MFSPIVELTLQKEQGPNCPAAHPVSSARQSERGSSRRDLLHLQEQEGSNRSETEDSQTQLEAGVAEWEEAEKLKGRESRALPGLGLSLLTSLPQPALQGPRALLHS